MTGTITADELAKLIAETGHAHHVAFAAANAIHPDWPIWYAGYLQTRLWDRLGRLPTRSELVYLLVGADKARRAEGEIGDWSEFYARFILTNF